MVKLTKIYTRGGDKGQTSLGDGTRISKTSLRIQAIGAIDELNASLGIASLFVPEKILQEIRHIQNDLFDVGGDLCIPETSSKKSLKLKDNQVQWLEKRMDTFNEALEPLSSFILPGGTQASAHLHLARTIARRAECAIIALSQTEKVNEEVIMYLNRLSDYLFVLCRVLNDYGSKDLLWVPGKTQKEKV